LQDASCRNQCGGTQHPRLHAISSRHASSPVRYCGKSIPRTIGGLAGPALKQHRLQTVVDNGLSNPVTHEGSHQ
jgi:hypothetical protein